VEPRWESGCIEPAWAVTEKPPEPYRCLSLSMVQITAVRARPRRRARRGGGGGGAQARDRAGGPVGVPGVLVAPPLVRDRRELGIRGQDRDVKGHRRLARERHQPGKARRLQPQDGDRVR